MIYLQIIIFFLFNKMLKNSEEIALTISPSSGDVLNLFDLSDLLLLNRDIWAGRMLGSYAWKMTVNQLSQKFIFVTNRLVD